MKTFWLFNPILCLVWTLVILCQFFKVFMNPSASLSKNFIMEGCFDFTDGLQCNPISSFLSETSLRFAKKIKIEYSSRKFLYNKKSWFSFQFDLLSLNWKGAKNNVSFSNAKLDGSRIYGMCTKWINAFVNRFNHEGANKNVSLTW